MEMLGKPGKEVRTHSRNRAEPKILLLLITWAKALAFSTFLKCKSFRLGYFGAYHSLFKIKILKSVHFHLVLVSISKVSTKIFTNVIPTNPLNNPMREALSPSCR